MLKAAEFFVGGQQLVRLNEKVIGEVSKDHGINATEMGILLFLSGNPSLDTAKDIVENRMMTKSSVSRAVDSLVRQGYIRTREDASDRRIIHLVLEEKADSVIELGRQAQEEPNDFSKLRFQTVDPALFRSFGLRLLSLSRISHIIHSLA